MRLAPVSKRLASRMFRVASRAITSESERMTESRAAEKPSAMLVEIARHTVRSLNNRTRSAARPEMTTPETGSAT
ncbi:hypothetical protein D9M69_696520 [compost metagenome]